MLSRTVYKKRRGRRLMTALAGLMIVSGTFFVSSVALAATPNGGLFELDGNTATDHGSGLPDDWDRVCHQVLTTDCNTSDNTTGATAVAWTPDTHAALPPLGACTGTNCTIFTGGGSKDPIDINQWAWKDDAGGLPDKDNLLHGFAARYSITSSLDCPGVNGETGGLTKCEMLFFGNDRFDNSGDAQQGFWFFQNKIGLGTNAVGGGQGFTTSSTTGEFHRNGDLLLISDFSNGGTTSTITVYKWDTTCKKAVNSPTPGQCGDANLRLLATSDNAKCSPADAAISGFCGIVNSGTITMSWPFLDKSGTPNNQAINGELYEGGVNLSSIGLGGECFASVASESRSSTSTTSVLKDFVLGSFGECGSTTTTTPKNGSGNNIATDVDSNSVPDLSIGTGSVTAQDSALVAVTGITTWAGNVQFSICGPLALSPTTSNCATGGDAIGGPVAVSNGNATALSPVTTFTSVGRYCWRADFTATTPNVPASSDGRTSECFEVLPVTPVLATVAGPDVTVNTAMTDTATLTGTANKPGSGGKGTDGSINPTTPGAAAGGTIGFVVKAGVACTATTLTVNNSPVTVSGDRDGVPASDVYGPVNATASTPGIYTFVATYTSDNANTNGAGPSGCPEATEEVTVTGTSSLSTAQNWIPNDTATLTGDANLNGTLTFVLYNDATCGNSSGTAVFSPAATTVTNQPSGTSFSTNNSGPSAFKVTATGHYSWLVTYVDTNLSDPAPSCSEVTDITIAN